MQFLPCVMLMMGVAAANAANYWTVGTIDDFNYYNESAYSGTDAVIENFNNGVINNPGHDHHRLRR